MDRIRLRLTHDSNVEILGCLRCDTALLPAGNWPDGAGAPVLHCPLCQWEVAVDLTEDADAFALNLAEQQLDAADTPVYTAESVTVADDMVLIDVPGLLEDHAFHALQNGVAPVSQFGWVGRAGILGDEGYRLVLVVRVSDLDEQDLFRVAFAAELVGDLALIDDERVVVLVSERKGVLFAEAGEVYLQAVRESGGKAGDRLTMSEWATVQG